MSAEVAMATKSARAEAEAAGMAELAASLDIGKVLARQMSEKTACVVLRADGSTEAITLDMTPRLKEPQKLLGGGITFVGMWEEHLDGVILMVNEDMQEEAKKGKKGVSNVNKHRLQPPFHEATVYGDILLQRSDEDGNPTDLPLSDYEKFTNTKIKAWQPK